VSLDPRAGPAPSASAAFSPQPEPESGDGIDDPPEVGDVSIEPSASPDSPSPATSADPPQPDPSIETSALASDDPGVDVERLARSAAREAGLGPEPRSEDETAREGSVASPARVEGSGSPAAPPSSAPGAADQAPPPTEPSTGPTRVARVVAVVNQKGGVGKSTTAVSVGAALAEAGYAVLVIDLDPQGNASTGLGIRHVARDVTTYEVLLAQAPIDQAIVPTAVSGLSAVPSTIDLAGAEIELVSQFSRETRLARALDPVRTERFDFILLDCPPSLGLLSVNALTAADELVVPIQCEYYALEGLGQLLRNVRLIQQNVNPDLRLSGIVMTMFDGRTKLSEQVVAEVRKYFGARVFDTVIPRTVRLSEAPGYGQPITIYDPGSKGSKAYRALALELAARGPEEEAVPQVGDLPAVITPAQRHGSPPPARAETEDGASRRRFRLFRRGGQE
jgi:chromosome partitioning protein